MMTRYVPYASRPHRVVMQLISDIVVIGWTALWVWIGTAVYTAVELADTRRGFQKVILGIARVAVEITKAMNGVYAEAKPKEREAVVAEFTLALVGYLEARLALPASP